MGELRTETEITYTADVEQGSLRLESRLVLTNLTPVVREGETTTRVYYEQIQLTVPETVQKLRATSEGRELAYTLRPGGQDEAQRFRAAEVWSAQPKNGKERGVDPPLFFRTEMPCDISEANDVDSADLLDEHFGCHALDLDLGAKGRGSGTR